MQDTQSRSILNSLGLLFPIWMWFLLRGHILQRKSQCCLTERGVGYRRRVGNYFKSRIILKVQNFSSLINLMQMSSSTIKKANIQLIFTVLTDGLLTFNFKYFWYYIKAVSHRERQIESLQDYKLKAYFLLLFSIIHCKSLFQLAFLLLR